MASIRLQNVSVTFPIYDARARSLKRRAMKAVTGGLVRADPVGKIGTDSKHNICVRALDHVHLQIDHGARLGLIGRNGVGKSTLLHVIAGIYVPEQGKVMVDGRIATLFGSFGIDPELSGRENIELRGLYLGLTRAEIRAKLDDIIDFTELGPFIEMPFRTYSAGMRARLDFAISTSIDAEILLLDEGLGTGDASFVEKAAKRLGQLAESASIVVLASHSESLLRRLCTHAVYLEAGRVVSEGPLADVLDQYRKSLGSDAAHSVGTSESE